uniref:Uncharacterized protein n=1 Tax=Anguilla anguilla TaxID=7936 RepID=A0A0E9QK89_ANGAN
MGLWYKGNQTSLPFRSCQNTSYFLAPPCLFVPLIQA